MTSGSARPMEQQEGTTQACAVSRGRRIAMVLLVFGLVAVVDQVTKTAIIATIPERNGYYSANEPPAFFRFTHRRNEGAVNGLFEHNRLMARAAPVAAVLVLLYLFRYLDPRSRVQTLAFGLTLGGAAGNLIDRFRLGSITDFLAFHFYFIPFDFPWKNFPPFNVADSCICTGVFMLVVSWVIMGQSNGTRSLPE